MKKNGLLFAVPFIAVVLILLLWPKTPPPPTLPAQNNPARQSNSTNNTPPAQNTAATLPSTPLPRPSPASATSSVSATVSSSSSSATNELPPGLAPLTVLDNARVVIHDYNSTFGENPVGNNSEITAALTGKNPKHINFVTAESGLRVNDKGEMLDAYGTPFFFHQISGKEMEIRSAGEDRIMWTFDDLVTR